ncbi:Uma2 family endonuclease [Streptomyces sp. bgisy153]|uniref:Uma2 family endonuclease n=1 Tax=Streptomyces sp. bgisy153 TaxID=3413793 RepID=UPI003D73F691
MTPRTEHRPQMSVEEFEELERHAPEHVRLEFVHGRVQVKPVTDGNHDQIVAWLQRLCMQHRPELWLYGDRGLSVEKYRKGRARPDGVLAPFGFAKGHGDWSDAAGVLMVVEVTSHDSDTDRRDRIEKPDGYAAAGIPVYLLVDRDDRSVVVFDAPEGGCYRHQEKLPFGATVALPAPVDITLDTAPLAELAECGPET